MQISAIKANKKCPPRKLSFLDVDLVGKAGEPVPTKVVDGNDQDYRRRVKYLKVN